MTKQKKGFLVFICSLVPGAGEMYMGFRKQGISIMLAFWGCLALASCSGVGFLTMFLPILWVYSFFNVHNLKSLSEEDFYNVEDTYILHLDQFIDDTDHFVRKYRKLIAILLIVFGVSILWNNLINGLLWLLPPALNRVLSNLFYRLPSILVAIAIIAAGLHLLKTKKLELDNEAMASDSSEKKEEEHYWEPYRPYQQPADEITPSENLTPPPTVQEPPAGEESQPSQPEAPAPAKEDRS